MRFILHYFLFIIASAASAAAAENAGAWRPLFNGRDLTGWDTYLTRPNKAADVPGEKRNEKGEYLEPIGLNRDPKKVFSIVRQDGAPAIRISGEIFGTITTKESFSDYQVRVELRWGEKKWPPRTQLVRDSGLLYHADGEWGSMGPWLPAMELQIQERDMGDFWAVKGSALIRARKLDEKNWIYDPAGAPQVFSHPNPIRRCIKLADFEKPHGEWNVIEVVCLGDRSWHIVNGRVVMKLEKTSLLDGETYKPVRSGRIQIQSEGAEAFVRKVELRPVSALPAEYASQAAAR